MSLSLCTFRADIMCGVPFFADEFNQVRVQHNLLVDFHRPWFCIRLGVVYGDFDLKRSVIQTTELLGDFSRIGQRGPADIQPASIPEAARFNNERVAFPLSDGVSVPPGFGIRTRKRPSVQMDLAKPLIGLIMITMTSEV
jgi:hypothetical protein